MNASLIVPVRWSFDRMAVRPGAYASALLRIIKHGVCQQRLQRRVLRAERPQPPDFAATCSRHFRYPVAVTGTHPLSATQSHAPSKPLWPAFRQEC